MRISPWLGVGAADSDEYYEEGVDEDEIDGSIIEDEDRWAG